MIAVLPIRQQNICNNDIIIVCSQFFSTVTELCSYCHCWIFIIFAQSTYCVTLWAIQTWFVSFTDSCIYLLFKHKLVLNISHCCEDCVHLCMNSNVVTRYNVHCTVRTCLLYNVATMSFSQQFGISKK